MYKKTRIFFSFVVSGTKWKKTAGFIIQKMQPILKHLLEHFIESKALISEEWFVQYNANQDKGISVKEILHLDTSYLNSKPLCAFVSTEIWVYIETIEP